MCQRLSGLLWDLREAISEAVWNSEPIAAAIAALEREGRDPQIALDVALLDSGHPALNEHTVAIPNDSGVTFDSYDIQFLRGLGISVEGEKSDSTP
jgi:hypothetical protein